MQTTAKDDLAAIVKSFGFIAVAKSISEEDRSYSISELEFVEEGNRHFGKNEFTKKLLADDDDGLVIRKALRRIKETQRVESLRKNYPRMASLTPTVATGNAVFNVNNGDRAKDLAEAIKHEMQTAPWLSVEQAIARVEAARQEIQSAAAVRRRT